MGKAFDRVIVALQRSLPPAADTRLPHRTAAVHDQTGVCPVQWHGDQAVVTLPEQMDVSNAGLIREELPWVINRGTALVVDMTATILCDRAGAAAVARARQRAVVSAPGCGRSSPPSWLRRVLSLSGLERLVRVYPSLEAALAVTAPAARTLLTLVDSPAGTGANGRQANGSPPDAPSGRGAAASELADMAGATPAAVRAAGVPHLVVAGDDLEAGYREWLARCSRMRPSRCGRERPLPAHRSSRPFRWVPRRWRVRREQRGDHRLGDEGAIALRRPAARDDEQFVKLG